MSGECGQASVEWVGLVLLVALSLAALVGFAPRADAGALGAELVHAIGCAARGGCEAQPGSRAAPAGDPRPDAAAPRGMVSAPPLVPIAPGKRSSPTPRPRALAERLTRGPVLVRGRALLRRVAPGAGALWRRSWILCLGYERARYGVLHPENRSPHVPIPLSENVRMVNDCLSPVDFVRDWDLFRGPR